MKCPIDQTPLAISDRQGIEIDYCPTCRGVWLDRGELDKLIERSMAPAPAAPPHHAAQPERRYEETRESYRPQEHRHDDHGGHHKKHKKESFLGDIFDF